MAIRRFFTQGSVPDDAGDQGPINDFAIVHRVRGSKRIIANAAGVALVSTVLAVPATAAQDPTGSLGTPTALGLDGASPHADLLADGTVRLYFPSVQTGGTAVAQCTLVGNCQIVGSIDRIADLTDVVLTDGSRRA
jgi:hypothetical protein